MADSAAVAVVVSIDTTGLNALRDDLVAIGALITSPTGKPLAEPVEFVVAEDDKWRERTTRRGVERLEELGIADAVTGAKAKSLPEIDAELVALLDAHSPDAPVRLLWDAADLDRCWDASATTITSAQLVVDGYAEARAGFVPRWLHRKLPRFAGRLTTDWVAFDSVRRYLAFALPERQRGGFLTPPTPDSARAATRSVELANRMRAAHAAIGEVVAREDSRHEHAPLEVGHRITVWVELDTTGPDPERDELLGISAVATDGAVNRIGPRFTALIAPQRTEWWRDLDPATRERLDAQQLLANLSAAVSDDSIEPLYEAEDRFAAWLDELQQQGNLTIATRHLDHDSRWIRSRLRKVPSRLQHRAINLRALELFLAASPLAMELPDEHEFSRLPAARRVDASVAALTAVRHRLNHE